MLRKDSNGVPIEVYGLKIHPLANMVPMATREEQAALKESIDRNGQREPILLYRDSIVDGRCRALACGSLGLTVVTKRLPHKTTMIELTKLIQDVNTRRNLTASQKAIVAYREWKGSKLKQKEVYSRWGVDKNNAASVKYLDTHSPDHLQLIFDGHKVALPDGKSSGSVQVVARSVKKDIEQLKAKSIFRVDIGFNPESKIKTEAGKEWFKNAIDELGGFDTHVFNAGEVMGLLANVADSQTVPAKPAKVAQNPTPPF